MVRPKEWFFLPLSVIKEVVNILQNDDIRKYKYNSSDISIARVEESFK